MRPGVTLVELLLVTALVAIVAGLASVAMRGVGERADTDLAQAECGTIAAAARRFAQDMGEPPRFLAELLQSPDPASANGGWWWRSDGTPAARLRRFDPAIRRGWNGPYLRPEADGGDADASEARLSATAPAVYAAITSDRSAGRRLALLTCELHTGEQRGDAAGRLLSHYQLDASRSGDLRVRLVADPRQAEAVEVAGASTGLRP